LTSINQTVEKITCIHVNSYEIIVRQ